MGVRRGLHGPDSVTWQLHADPAMWAAGISGLYLQALHPRAAAGIVQHSRFRADPLGRLANTAAFVSLATYGDPDDIEAGAARVRTMHRRLRGRDPETGAEFAVDDPELLLWVHCAEAMTYLDVVARAGFPISQQQAERYLDEQRVAAGLVGLNPDDVPGSRAAMEDYLADVLPALRAGPDAQLIRGFLRRPRLRRPLASFVGGYDALVGQLAYSLLPSWALRLYGQPAYSRTHATRQLRALRALAFAIPTRVRWNMPTSAGHVLAAIELYGEEARPRVDRMPRS